MAFPGRGRRRQVPAASARGESQADCDYCITARRRRSWRHVRWSAVPPPAPANACPLFRLRSGAAQHCRPLSTFGGTDVSVQTSPSVGRLGAKRLHAARLSVRDGCGLGPDLDNTERLAIIVPCAVPPASVSLQPSQPCPAIAITRYTTKSSPSCVGRCRR